MPLSPCVEGREFLLPSPDIVDGHSALGVHPTRYYHCVTVGDGTGIAGINNKHSRKLNYHFSLTLYHVQVGSPAPGSRQV